MSTSLPALRSKFSLPGRFSAWSMHESGTNIKIGISAELLGTRNYLLVVIRRD